MMQFLRLVGMRGHTVQRIADQCDAPEGTVRNILDGASVKHGSCFERCGTQGKKLLWRVNEQWLALVAENEALRRRVAELEHEGS